MSRKSRRRKKNAEKAVGEVTDFIEDNPVTSAVAALAAGALATTLFKMNMDRHEQRVERQVTGSSKESAEPEAD